MALKLLVVQEKDPLMGHHKEEENLGKKKKRYSKVRVKKEKWIGEKTKQMVIELKTFQLVYFNYWTKINKYAKDN